MVQFRASSRKNFNSFFEKIINKDFFSEMENTLMLRSSSQYSLGCLASIDSTWDIMEWDASSFSRSASCFLVNLLM